MGNRFWNDHAPSYVSFSERWPNAGIGRYWKRRLSKARRAYHKQILRGNRARYPVGIEQEVNYRTW